MKRKLERIAKLTWYFDMAGNRRAGVPSGVSGNFSGVRGNLTGVWGNLTGVWGDLSGVRGNLTGVRGNLDECEITDEDRQAGIDISQLLREDRE